jgi:HEAT repeat protein
MPAWERVGAAVGAMGLVLAAGGLACGGEPAAPPGGGIAWRPGLVKAFAEAKEAGRPLLVAINSVIAEGEGVEVASKLLRTEVYLDPAVVAASKDFVCVLLQAPLTTEDGGELRSRFGIEGMIVTPQHLLLHADGTLVQRKEYWEHHDLATSVAALTAMMSRAMDAHRVRGALPALGSDAASRAAWIEAAKALVRTHADEALRGAAVRELVASDREGDALRALHALLPPVVDPKRADAGVWVAVLRALARDGFADAVPGLVATLEAKDPVLRAHAAVSLEHVGSPKALEALGKRAGKEKDESVKAHVLRAMGRCGAKDAAVRKALLREAQAKSDRTAVAALVALARFEGDVEVARALEKPYRGSSEGVRRNALLWALARTGDARTKAFLETELQGAPENAYGTRLIQAAVARLGGEGAHEQSLASAVTWGMREEDKTAAEVRSGRGGSGHQPLGDPPSRDG